MEMGTAGVAWRAPTLDDLAAWARLIEVIEPVDHDDELMSTEELRKEFETSWARPGENARFAFDEADGLVAFAWLGYTPHAERRRRLTLWGGVHPRWRGRGLGTALMDWLERRAVAVAEALPGDLPVTIEVSTNRDNAERIAFLTERGYQPLRHWYEMRRELTEPIGQPVPLPDGVVLREWDEVDSETLRLAHNETFADHWGSEPMTPEVWQRWMVTASSVRTALSFVLCDGDDVAGYLLTRFYPQDADAKGFTEAWVGTIGTRRRWRRRGLAAAMLAEALTRYAAEGFDYGSLGVDTENPSGALRVYERAGFVTVAEHVTYARGLPGGVEAAPAG